MSHNSTYLQLTPHGVYYYRIAKTKPLHLCFGKRELKKTIRTSDRKKTISHAMALSITAGELFQRAYFMGANNSDGNRQVRQTKTPLGKFNIKKEVKNQGG